MWRQPPPAVRTIGTRLNSCCRHFQAGTSAGFCKWTPISETLCALPSKRLRSFAPLGQPRVAVPTFALRIDLGHVVSSVEAGGLPFPKWSLCFLLVVKNRLELHHFCLNIRKAAELCSAGQPGAAVPTVCLHYAAGILSSATASPSV
jgi:hypothetical protein